VNRRRATKALKLAGRSAVVKLPRLLGQTQISPSIFKMMLRMPKSVSWNSILAQIFQLRLGEVQRVVMPLCSPRASLASLEG